MTPTEFRNLRPVRIDYGKDWSLYKSEVVLKQPEELKQQVARAYRLFKNTFPNHDSTLSQTEAQSGFSFYNVFALTSPSPLFWLLFRDIRRIVRNSINPVTCKMEDGQPLWIQSWINYHTPGQVLDWHGHDYPWHGYVSIDPKDTTTVFKGDEEYYINNSAGNIYFGPGDRSHKVIVNSDYTGPRITIGFDILDEPSLPDDSFSLIPLL
tara:strand:+ start:313 stop:939 length:627 start_codon:yes stop_codon:yes gene_type:complete